MIKDLLHNAEDRMNKTIEALRDDLHAIRTGRASPALVERLMIDYYGMPTPLLQLATISAPEARLITIKPFSPADLGAIERTIQKSDLGLNPSSDGKIIRLLIPQLTEERRRDIAKVVTKRVEESRIAIRNIRRDEIEDMRELEKEKLISEDDLHHGRDEIQKLTDRFIERVDEIGRAKEAEIMEV